MRAMTEEKKHKRLALIYCANKGIDFEEFYYGRKLEEDSRERKEPQGCMYETIEDLQGGFIADGNCYHDTKNDLWFYALTDLNNSAITWKKLKDKYPEIERYRIERIYCYKGARGTRKELSRVFMIRPKNIRVGVNAEPVGFKMVKK